MTQHIIPLLILLPLAAGALAFLIRADLPRRALLVLAALAHFALTVAAWRSPLPPTLFGWLALDDTGRLFLGIASTLFLAAAFYGIGYLAREKREAAAPHRDLVGGGIFTNAPEAVLTGCLLFFLATMTLVCLSNHLGLLWVAWKPPPWPAPR